tara:strand:+ start:255 stop:1415 length:1161 start_codon:yes stop_codon:yes gene_type:complete
MHAEVGIMFRKKMLSTNTFNVTRVSGRAELIREAWPMLEMAGEQVTATYPRTRLTHDTAQFCAYLSQSWEIETTDIAQYSHNGRLPDVKFPLYPYLIERGGTIIFAAPGSGKSYLVQAMAVSIASGLSHLWVVEQRPVLYINLERSGNSLERREHQLVTALGLPGQETGVRYLHMRGSPLPTILRKAKPIMKDHPDMVVILDSVSRAGLGSLIDDQVAMEFIDMMGNLGLTWLAIGHTPRSSADHIFGSVHYDAGADIAVKLNSVEKSSTLGVMLEMTKANDVRKPKPDYYGFDFNERDELANVRTTIASEFPELQINEKKSPTQKIAAFILLSGGSAWQGDIADATLIDPGNLSTLLNGSKEFFVIEAQGRRKKWGMRTQNESTT